MVNEHLVFAAINVILSLGITFMAFCRINSFPAGTSLLTIAPYSLVLTSGLVSACQPWYDQWPTAGHIFISVAFFVYFLSTKNKSSPSA